MGGASQDPETRQYIESCLNRFCAGDFGDVPQEEIDANTAALKRGEGSVLGRYKKSGALKNDIFIEAYFDEDYLDELDYTNITVMYITER